MRCVRAVGMLLGVLAATPVAVAAETPIERRLHVAEAEASSYLVNDWNKFQENYLPQYLGDDDPVTAWTDGIKGEGIGEWVRVHVTPMKGATRVRLSVRNGYQKTKRLFAANARARSVVIKLLPSGTARTVELADAWDWQDVVVEQPAGPFDAVELRFDSVYPGTKYDDVCVSDVRVFVTATSPENPAFEKQRFDKLLTWKAERVKAAKLFKSEAGKGLPVASQYVVGIDEQRATVTNNQCSGSGSVCPIRALVAAAMAEKQDPLLVAHARAIALADELLRDGFRRGTPVQVAAQDKRRMPAVDGLCTPKLDVCEDDPCYGEFPMPLPGQLGFLDATGLSTLDLKDPPTIAQVEALEVKACKRQQPTTFAWVVRAPAAAGTSRLQALYLSVCGLVNGREGYFPFARSQLLVFDEQGRLELTADTERVATYDWRQGDHGPRLAGGRRFRWDGERMTLREAESVAKR